MKRRWDSLGDRHSSPMRLFPGARRVVSEGSKKSERARLPDFPADCPHRTDCHCPCSLRLLRGTDSTAGFSGFPANSRVFLSPLPTRVATSLRLHPNRRPHLRRLPPLRVRPPASGVANFRGVTGGVYKTRERIHRSVADLRLLATPTSWGRVADPNPNLADFFGIRSPLQGRSPLWPAL
jgi:hypothetical protein